MTNFEFTTIRKLSMNFFLSFAFCSFIITSILAQNAPIDFEENGNGADWIWTTFENDSNPGLEIVPNPDSSGINTSSTVAKFTALQAGQPFAGCESLHGDGIGDFVIDESNSIIRIMVWKSVVSDVGIKLVRADNWSLGEIKIPNTLVNEWEQIEFDFSDHIGNPYDQIVIFPDFNNRQQDNIIYFDNVYGEASTSTNTIEIENAKLNIIPNPASNSISIKSKGTFSSYEIYSITGELVDFRKSMEDTTINIVNLPKGIYFLKVYCAGKIAIEKFIKE